MITIISPAKSLNFQFQGSSYASEVPVFSKEAIQIMQELKMLTLHELKAMMKISDKLAQLNDERHNEWMLPGLPEKSLQAVFAFDGDVYDGLKAREMNEAEIEFSQNHLRILSGLYGVLRPLDNIMAYRLEMGVKKAFVKKKSLYDFWKPTLQKYFVGELEKSGSSVILNLASQEYSKAVLPFPKEAGVDVAEALFYEQRGKKLQMVSFFAKRARGLMSRFIIENRINELEQIEAFDLENYLYHPELSDSKTKVFVR